MSIVVDAIREMRVGGWVNGLCFMKDGVRIVIAKNAEIVVLHMFSGETMKKITSSNGKKIYSVCCVPGDEHSIVIGGSGGVVSICNVKTGVHTRTFVNAHSGEEDINDVWTDGKRLISAGRIVALWDLSNSKLIKVFEHHHERADDTDDFEVWSARILPGGARLVSCAADGTALITDLKSGKIVHEMQHGNSLMKLVPVNSLSITPDGKYSVTGDDKGVLRIWDNDSGDCRSIHDDDSLRAIWSVSVLPLHGRFFVMSQVGLSNVPLWDIQKNKKIGYLRMMCKDQKDCSVKARGNVTRTLVSPNGFYVLAGTSKGHVMLWDIGFLHKDLNARLHLLQSLRVKSTRDPHGSFARAYRTRNTSGTRYLLCCVARFL